MRRDKDLIKKDNLDFEEFEVQAEIYNISIRENYSTNNKELYSIELVLTDSTDENYSYSKTIDSDNIKELSWLESFINNLIGNEIYYDSIYEFTTKTVIEAAIDAREKRGMCSNDNIDKLTDEEQAQIAFESLSEV